jgi:glucosylceramidase
LAAALGAAAVQAQDIKLTVSSAAGDRLADKPDLHFTAAPSGKAAGIRIEEAKRFQRMDGFGASFLEAGMICLNSLPPAGQEKVLQSLFDPVKGAGFTAMKTPIAGTDFMSAGPWFTYDDTPGDVEMKHFSIARDLGPNGLITYIKRARKYGQFKLQAPMDYPPDWMLVDVNKNQDVNPKYYDALALYYLKYLQAYEQAGVFIDYLSLFNEPGVYTKIRWDEILKLFRDHVGPLLEREGCKTQLMPSEAVERREAGKSYPLIMDDPGARRYVAVLPYHGYDVKNFDKIARLHARYPDTPLWMTEYCYAYEADYPTNIVLPRYDFADGDNWGNIICSDLEAGASAWLYWNAILDEKGGPWAVSPIHGNPDPNIQHAPVIINRQTGQVSYTGVYYYLAHFSKFVRPGAVRIGTAGVPRGVRCLAFVTPEKGMVVELLNHRKKDAAVNLRWRDQTVRVTLPAISITTLRWAGAD